MPKPSAIEELTLVQTSDYTFDVNIRQVDDGEGKPASYEFRMGDATKQWGEHEVDRLVEVPGGTIGSIARIPIASYAIEPGGLDADGVLQVDGIPLPVPAGTVTGVYVMPYRVNADGTKEFGPIYRAWNDPETMTWEEWTEPEPDTEPEPETEPVEVALVIRRYDPDEGVQEFEVAAQGGLTVWISVGSDLGGEILVKNAAGEIVAEEEVAAILSPDPAADPTTREVVVFEERSEVWRPFPWAPTPWGRFALFIAKLLPSKED